MEWVENPDVFNAPAAFHRVTEAHDNLRAAQSWALANGRPEIVLRIGTALWLFWSSQGHLSEGRRRLEEALAVSAELPALLRAHALRAAGNLAFSQFDVDAARAFYDEALLLYRAIDHKDGISSCLNNLANLATDYERDYARACSLYEEAIALARARSTLEEAVALAREAGYSVYGWALAQLGLVATRQGDFAQARTYLHESLLRAQTYGATSGIMEGLLYLGYLAAAEGQKGHAARLLGAVDALRDELGTELTLMEQEDHEAAIAALRAALGNETFETEWAAGRAMTSEAAVDYALAVTG
jgi:non-specific serine/threonine protein kinase